MRRVAVLALLALALPMAAWASGIDLVNEIGTLSITASGIATTGTGSFLVNYGGHHALVPGYPIGHVTFNTGAFTPVPGGSPDPVCHSLGLCGTFSDANSNFDVTSNTTKFGMPVKGPLFTGTFVGPIDWTLVSMSTPTSEVYQLSGTIQGQMWNGRMVTGSTTQTIDLFVNEWQIEHDGHTRLGQTHLNTPEPTTLGLLGTGLVGIAGMFRRKKS